MQKKVIQTVITLLCLFSMKDATANSFSEIRFQQLTINDGLSLSSVYVIFQDSKGYMWFGTEDGLNKFDGSSFTVYRTGSTYRNSISHKWIEIIFEDSEGILWLGSRGGLTRLNPATEEFLQYTTNAELPYQISNDTVLSIEQLNDSILLVGTQNGINTINLATLKYNALFPNETSSLTEADLLTVIEENVFLVSVAEGFLKFNLHKDERVWFNLPEQAEITNLILFNDTLWAGSNKGVLFCSLEEAENNSNPTIQKLEGTNNLVVEQLLFSSDSSLWIAADEGLFFSEKRKELRKIVDNRNQTQSLALVKAISLLEDNKGDIWFTTHGNGVYRYNTKNDFIEQFQNNPCKPESLTENSINCIFQNASGIIWLGTFGAGISIYNPHADRFKLITSDPTSSNTLASNFVWTICEDSKGRIWVGSNDKGITLYQPKENKFLNFDHNPANPNSLSHSSVRKIYEDSEGIIWIGTDGGGLNRFNEQSQTFSHYTHSPGKENSISGNSVRAIYEDNDGTLWVGTQTGLNRLNKATMRFERFTHQSDDPNSISHNFVYSAIHHDKNGNLWIGTYGGGLNKLNIGTGKFEHFLHNSTSQDGLSDNIVFSIHEDDKGILWIGTNSKLNRFDPKSGKVTYFGLEQGLPNEVIYGVIPDNSGNLWLSTNLGLCYFNRTDFSVINYNVTHGLQSNEFNGGAYHRGPSGNLYFGGVYGLNIIPPLVHRQSSDLSNVVFTGLEILGQPVAIQNDSKPDRKGYVQSDSAGFYMHPHISYCDFIELDYENRQFSLEFTDLGYLQQQAIKYAYKMEGLDKEWTYSGDRNYVSYAGLAPGEYILHVRSQLPDGSWSNKIAQLGIIINPPFWKTWWFILLEVLIIATLAFVINRYVIRLRTYRLLEQQNEQIREANRLLRESEQELLTTNATKDKFFSIISHDLKNPFTSLLSLSEMLKDSYGSLDEEEKKGSVMRIFSSVKQLYSLLENLLTWSRTQSNRINFQPADFNLSNLLWENYNLYGPVAEGKAIHLKAEIQENLNAYGDRDMVNTVIRNVLNNAIKFTPEGKSISLEVNENLNHYQVIIRDEGIGISAENMEKLFRIDKKIKTLGTDGEKGTGLGLIICKEFIEKNSGEIHVESIEGKGSTFYFTLPKQKPGRDSITNS
jgi:ligand-binding sensor domain-containing protein/signal transduction histidine kinase